MGAIRDRLTFPTQSSVGADGLALGLREESLRGPPEVSFTHCDFVADWRTTR